MLINMKKFFTRFATVAMTLVAAFSFVACDEEKVEEVAVSDATVEVAVTAKDAQSATFAITTTKAVAVAYYRTTDTKFIGTGDFVFKNGKEVEPNTTVSVSMPYLEEMSDYRLIVAARAENGAYTVTNTNVHVPDFATSVSISVDKVTYSVADITVTPDEHTVEFMVGFGPASATVEQFLAGEIPTMNVEGNEAKEVGLEGLKANTEYVVYAQSYNREGTGCDVVSKKFTTPDGPAVDIEVSMDNSIVADVKITPNQYVSQYAFILAQQAIWDEYKVMMGTDDSGLLQTFYSWDMTEMATEALEDQVEMSGICGDSFIIGVLVFDENGQPYDVQFETFSSPEKDENAAVATVEIGVGTLTPNSAELSFTMGGGAVGYYCALLTKANYDDINSKSETNLFNNVVGFGTVMTQNDTDNWKVDAGVDYVAVAVPFNVNGADGGLGELVEARFTAPIESTAAVAVAPAVKAPKATYKYVTAEQFAKIAK